MTEIEELRFKSVSLCWKWGISQILL